jgi:hypothetical protein
LRYFRMGLPICRGLTLMMGTPVGGGEERREGGREGGREGEWEGEGGKACRSSCGWEEERREGGREGGRK